MPLKRAAIALASLVLAATPQLAGAAVKDPFIRTFPQLAGFTQPTQQQIADLAQITPEQLNLGPGFETGSPLWAYILHESQRTEGGKRLGPTGSVIVKAGFDSAATNAVKAETGNPGTVPNTTITGPDGVMTVSDLFKFAGVA